jgi:hypothetical protein
VTQLPEPAPRVEVHTRRFEFRCYFRNDRMWDIEAALLDIKPYAYTVHRRYVEAGEPIHRMKVRLTIDDDMVVRNLIAVMENSPFPECNAAIEPMRAIIGLKMSAGWRKAVDNAIGGIEGCTHMRELLYNAATVAYQSLPSHKTYMQTMSGAVSDVVESPPAHLDKCKSWALDGAVVQREMPQFYVSDRSPVESRAPKSSGEGDRNASKRDTK